MDGVFYIKETGGKFNGYVLYTENESLFDRLDRV